jgi:hypothetical protein
MEYNNLGQPIVRTTASGSGYSNTGNTNTGIDAFGRQRVSEPFTLFDNSFRYSDDSLNWNSSTSGTTQQNHLPSEASISMFVDTGSGDSIIRETKRVFQYQPGKSLLVMNTFVMEPAKTNLRQRVGYFGADNGIFVQLANNTVSMVKRSSITSGVVDTEINQSSWNVDPIDGTGPSGVTLDMSKAQIFWTDMEWLGVGSVRTGFVINGQFILCHVFHHANIIDSVYMTTASLPIRYEITNTGATASSSTMKQICSTVISEGGYSPSTIPRSISNPVTGVALSDSLVKPLVLLRLKTDKPDGIVVPRYVDVYGLQNSAFKWRLVQHPTISTGSFVSAGAESPVEYNITATDTINTGTNLLEGTFVGGSHGGSTKIDLHEYNHGFQLRRRLDGTREIFALCAIATSNNNTAVGTVAWQEFN